MKLLEFKTFLGKISKVEFCLSDGKQIPPHFHITEVGLISKHFIDCGGTIRKEQKVNFQLWDSSDYDHRMQPEKLLNIISLSESKLGIDNLDVEVEYQSDTIGKYALKFDGSRFVLHPIYTTCLADDACGIKSDISLGKAKTNLAGTCLPGSGCC